jgi:hypothetical protein
LKKSADNNGKLRKLRIAQLVLIALLAVLFMGADSDARFNALGHQLMCLRLQPGFAGMQSRRLHLLGPDAQRVDGRDRARR